MDRSDNSLDFLTAPVTARSVVIERVGDAVRPALDIVPLGDVRPRAEPVLPFSAEPVRPEVFAPPVAAHDALSVADSMALGTGDAELSRSRVHSLNMPAYMPDDGPGSLLSATVFAGPGFAALRSTANTTPASQPVEVHSLGLTTADVRSATDGALVHEPMPAPNWMAQTRSVARIAVLAFGAWIAANVVLIAAYRIVDPPTSTLMLYQRLTGGDIDHSWVPLDAISPNVVRAVLLSEDGRFCQHGGVDFEEMQNAIERAGDGVPRGASTISMQVIKNLFLWQSKSYVRKAIEIPLTYVMETLWPKSRIMEVYLNIAEWGPGIFGVEAASRFHFNKPAARLSEREAAQLAVALPNPIRRDAGDPGPKTRRLASDIQGRMRAAPGYASACVGNGRSG